MRVRLLAEAEDEAREAARWYDERQPDLGLDFLDAVARALEAIEATPQRFGRVPKLRTQRDVRRYILPRFPYTIVYEVLADEVLVLAVAHDRRRPHYWKYRRG